MSVIVIDEDKMNELRAECMHALEKHPRFDDPTLSDVAGVALVLRDIVLTVAQVCYAKGVRDGRAG